MARIRRNQSTCLLGSLTWAAKYTSKLVATQTYPKLARLFFAMFGQWNICVAGVLVGEGPHGFTVANKVKVERHRRFVFGGHSLRKSAS
jgi:hypothetical protein